MNRPNQFGHWIARGIILLIVMATLFFWMTPYDQRNDGVSWFALGMIALGAFYLALIARMHLTRWRGLALVSGIHLTAQAWVLTQSALWNAPLPLIRNLNVVAELVAMATLIAMLVSLACLLIYRDASVPALVVALVSFPVLWLGLARYYGGIERMNQADLPTQVAILVPLCLIMFLLLGGALALLIHGLHWVVIELRAQD